MRILRISYCNMCPFYRGEIDYDRCMRGNFRICEHKFGGELVYIPSKCPLEEMEGL